MSIVIPTRCRSSSLDRLLKSLHDAGVTGKEGIEVIVVDNNDDGSADAIFSKVICETWGASCIREQRRGKCHALNTGIATATGVYLLFTDDDVVVDDPAWVEKMRQHFRGDPRLGYVAGTVKAALMDSAAARMWEAKGGLSKGPYRRHWSQLYLRGWRFRLRPWPLHKLCVGANCMIPSAVLAEVGGLNPLLENGVVVAGGTLELGYRIARAGYDMVYDPVSVVRHHHPERRRDLLRKMLRYGIGDTACHMCIFLEHRDVRSLIWALLGHPAYTAAKIVRRSARRYPLPVPYLLAGLLGNLIGGPLLVGVWACKGRRK